MAWVFVLQESDPELAQKLVARINAVQSYSF